MNNSTIFTLLLILLAGVLPTQSMAQNPSNSSDLVVQSIVLSKNCPLPDGPDLVTNYPERVLESIDDPYCPQKNDIQLIQIKLLNRSEKTQSVGVEIVVHIDEKQQVEPYALKKILTIPAYDEERLLHDVILEKGGRYRISAKLWDTDYAHLLTTSHEGINRQFYIVTEQDVSVAEQALIVQEETGQAKAPKPLEFDPPDLRWAGITILPEHLLRGETMRIRLNLVNVGGDIVRDIESKVEYFHVRQPRRREIIARPFIALMAPGEVVTQEFNFIIPEDRTLGNYKISVTVDPDHLIEELKESNNTMDSGMIRLSDIRLVVPEEKFVFAVNELFLFKWDSIAFSEFQIEVGIDQKFEDRGNYFGLPSGDRWISGANELVPLSGELGMALELMKNYAKNKLYWRVVGRKNGSSQKVYSEIRSFTIKTDSDAS